VELAPVDLKQTVADAQSGLAKEIQDAGATLVVSVSGSVLSSHTFLVQVITNLIGNALKFVAPNTKPHINIVSETTVNSIRLKITDNGIGIPPEHLGRIFKIFERLDPSYAGTGIGLAIVDKAARRIGGRIGVQSTPGQGSTFWIDLPPTA
jgi:signal transduction histidine kinase